MGAGVNYYERHIGDYLKDTAHLSLLEHGIYSRLLDVYYTREASIPDDQVIRLIGARTREEKDALKAVLQEFFRLDETGWRQDRCDREIERFQDKQRKASASATARWSARTPHSERSANAPPNAMRTHSEGNAPNHQTPDTRHQKKNTSAVAPPDGVSESVWKSFEALRAKRRAPITEIAMEGIVREAKKAGLTLEQALQKCCEKSWTGFEADWLKPGGAQPPSGPDPVLEKLKRDAERATPIPASIREKLGQAVEAMRA